MDVHFNAYKVKFDMMNSMFDPIFSTRSISTVNIFINLDDLYHKLHRPLINNEFQVDGDNAYIHLVSNVYNLIAHYKEFFARCHKKVSIYGIYTLNQRNFKNSIYIFDYRLHYSNINSLNNADYFFINNAIQNTDSIINSLSDYIDDVYVIDSRFIEPSVIPYYINEEVNPASFNVMISKDLYDYQYATKPNWVCLYPKGEDSALVTAGNLWNFIAYKEKIELYQNYDWLSSDMYTIALALNGDKYRNIPRIKRIGWKSIFNLLDAVAEDKREYMTDRDLIIDKVGKVDLDKVNNNLFSTNIEKQYKLLGSIDKEMILTQIHNIPDSGNLIEINNRYFMRFPINLGFLTNNNVMKKKNPFGI